MSQKGKGKAVSPRILFVIVPLVIVAALANALSDRFFPAYSLPTAAAAGNVAEVQKLLAAGADVEARDKNSLPPLYEAAAAGHVEVVQLLLDHGAKVEGMGGGNMTPLSLAAGRDQLKVMEALLAAGAKPDGASGSVPALYEAVMFGRPQAVKLLLAHDADPNVSYKGGVTPLMCASLHTKSARAEDMLEICRALVAAGAKVNASSRAGLTPLHYAARSNEATLAGFLLSAGADVNARDPKGMTPLHYAAQKGSEEVVQVLLNAGAKRDLKNRAGQTPAQLAQDPDLLKLLQYQP